MFTVILCPQGRFRAGCGHCRLRAQSPRIPCRSIATCLADTKDLPKQLLSYYFTFLFPRASNPYQEHCVPFCDVTKCDATADVLLKKPPVIVRRPSCFRGICREKERRRQTLTADLESHYELDLDSSPKAEKPLTCNETGSQRVAAFRPITPRFV